MLPKNTEDPEIVIVSGLPRSGTSMMMAMLEAGGMGLLVDHIRKADESNPKGYFEFEKVKEIKQDDSWLKNAKGRAVKIISILLYHLPMDKRYKVIFMERDLNETLSSQNRMLKKRNQPVSQSLDDEMIGKFNIHLKKIKDWLNTKKNIDVLFINYNRVISDPVYHAEIVSRFIGNHLDAREMSNVVDYSLYRQRR